MLEAIITNQIREKDKVEVLCKYLKGQARELIGEHYTSLDTAFDALLKHYGVAKKTWESKVKNFLLKCKKPRDWNDKTSRNCQDL